MSKKTKDDYLSQLLFIQQKNIHYKSEITKHIERIKVLEQEIEKEKYRNSYLQQKLREAQEENFETCQKEIVDLKNKLLSFEVSYEEEKCLVRDLQDKFLAITLAKSDEGIVLNTIKNTSVQAYFQYATLLPSQDIEMKNLTLFGNLNILNNGTEPISGITICIKINPKESGKLSGKIGMTKPKEASHSLITKLEEWEYATKAWKEKIREDGEYWIRSTQERPLEPDETLTFPNFEVNIMKPEKRNGINIEGYIYCNELQKGIQTMNNIIVNFA